jgi:hypothetical protein
LLNSGCSSTITYNVFIGANPSASIINNGVPVLCNPGSVQYSIIPGGQNTPGTIYSFQVNDNTPPQSSTSPLLTSVNFFTGLQYENFKIGLSYDAITSKIGKSGGTFELGLVYQFDLDARKCFGCPINE